MEYKGRRNKVRKLKVVSFTPHPDDMEILCGGTLLKYKQQGHDVIVVIGTDGRRGRGKLPDSVTWQEIIEIRRKEACKACAFLGVEPLFLDMEDHRVIDDRECYEKVITAMESINPDIIFTCDPDDYHSDHRAMSRLVLNSAWAPVMFMEVSGGVNFIPDYYVDITSQMDTKIEMVRQHQSQFKEDPEERVRVLNRFRGMQCGKSEIKYAETFRAYKRHSWVKSYELLPKDDYELQEQIVPTMERN